VGKRNGRAEGRVRRRRQAAEARRVASTANARSRGHLALSPDSGVLKPTRRYTCRPLRIESPSIMSIRTDSSQPDGAWSFKALETGPSDEPPHSKKMAPMMTNSSMTW
jgi:hypothetical protein